MHCSSQFALPNLRAFVCSKNHTTSVSTWVMINKPSSCKLNSKRTNQTTTSTSAEHGGGILRKAVVRATWKGKEKEKQRTTENVKPLFEIPSLANK